MSNKRCSKCRENLSESEFSKTQWKNKDDRRKCIGCTTDTSVNIDKAREIEESEKKALETKEKEAKEREAKMKEDNANKEKAEREAKKKEEMIEIEEREYSDCSDYKKIIRCDFIQNIDSEKFDSVKLVFRQEERIGKDIDMLNFTYDIPINLANQDVIKTILNNCKKHHDRLIHKFDSIWVACDPKKRNGKKDKRKLKRVVVAQSDNHNHLKVIQYFPDHTNGKSDPYNRCLFSLYSKWISVNPDKYSEFFLANNLSSPNK